MFSVWDFLLCAFYVEQFDDPNICNDSYHMQSIAVGKKHVLVRPKFTGFQNIRRK